MLTWLFNRGTIKIVVCTEIHFGPQDKEFAATCHRYDPTFSARYYDAENPDWLHGETFWDQDKYNIFYLDVPSKDVDSFVKDITPFKACSFIAEIDKDYNLKISRQPFYMPDAALDYEGKLAFPYARRRDTRYPLRTPAPGP